MPRRPSPASHTARVSVREAFLRYGHIVCRRRAPRWLSQQTLDRLSQIVSPLARDGAEWDDLFGIEREIARDGEDVFGALLSGELVDLRENDDGWHADLAEKVQHCPIIGRRIVADVEQKYDAAQLLARSNEPLDQRPPLGALFLGDSRVAIARQVD